MALHGTPFKTLAEAEFKTLAEAEDACETMQLTK